MLTGTPLDLAPFGAVLTGIGLLYWIVALAAAAFAARLPKPWWGKVTIALLVLAAFIGPVARHVWHQNEEQAQARAKFEAASALFRARCAEAKTIIRRVIEDVEGVWLTQVRPVASIGDKRHRLWALAALPQEAGGDGYIQSFLYWEHHDDKRNDRGFLNTDKSDLPGYRFVDIPDQAGRAIRYMLVNPPSARLSKEALSDAGARYAVSYESLDDPVGREH